MPTTTVDTPDAATALFRAPPLRHIDVGAGEVAYRRVGSGPDVLFVHGWPVSSATYRHLLPHLAPHVTCHLFDFPGAGDSRFGPDTELSLPQHIETVRRVVDALGLTAFAAIGHDSGGLIARHALAGDARLTGLGLLNTEQSSGLAWKFRMFLATKGLPGLSPLLGFAMGTPWLRRLALDGCFVDPAQLHGEFATLFLDPLHDDPAKRDAATRLLRSFDTDYVHRLKDVHARIDVPVQMVWGDRDPFFPLDWAEEMVETFPDARLHVVKDAALFVHEEKPDEVAGALLPVLLGDTVVRAAG